MSPNTTPSAPSTSACLAFDRSASSGRAAMTSAMSSPSKKPERKPGDPPEGDRLAPGGEGGCIEPVARAGRAVGDDDAGGGRQRRQAAQMQARGNGDQTDHDGEPQRECARRAFANRTRRRGG